MRTKWMLKGLVSICKIVSITIVLLAVIDGVFDRSSDVSFEVWLLKVHHKAK